MGGARRSVALKGAINANHPSCRPTSRGVGADPIPPGSFTIVNSASFEGPPVSRGAFLTVFTDTPVTDEKMDFTFGAPGTFSTPGGVSVETDECGGTLGPIGPNTKLPLLFVGPTNSGGTQINFYYPNSFNRNAEFFGTCLNGGFDRFTVRPKSGFGQPRVRDINTNSFRIGIFADGNGDAPVGFHLNAVTGATTPFSAPAGTPACKTSPTACPVATNGVPNILILFTTGGETLSCPNQFQNCQTSFTRARFILSRPDGFFADQRVIFYGPDGFLGQEQANVQLLPGTAPGNYKIEAQAGLESGFPASGWRPNVSLGPANTV